LRRETGLFSDIKTLLPLRRCLIRCQSILANLTRRLFRVCVRSIII
jgi:hypothetical protein